MSVIVPVRDAVPYLAAAVESALDQKETLEVLLIEDGSRDDSPEVCHRLTETDARVRLLRHPDAGSHGPAASRNLGLGAARGPYIAFLDADDWYLAGRFARSIRILDGADDVDGVYEAVGVHFEDEEARAEWGREPHRGALITLPSEVRPENLLAWLLDGRGNFHTGGIVVRRRVFDFVGRFDEELRFGSDTAMWWKLAACHRLVAGNVVTPVAMYRRHGGNLTSIRAVGYRQASVRVAAAVWQWAEASDIPQTTRERIHAAVIHRVLSAPPGVTGVRGVFARLRRVPAYLIGYPRLLSRPRLWREVITARLLEKFSGRRAA